ncbi:MAG: DNA translocase FtsK 4TM domain-containing protein [Oceanibaculum nanhaiense]|uniref:FtsK/SpoIIIE family DNA translocase n=1 Tax=Oceanibaculum nanhaiense TaxID=1909734 RepID=UPI0025A3DBA0|nr:DNA translocase FtsK 4TM domain-containing protein [Oceanibaculum nanhaiense]MDM7945867.1 DNA translocase FtsK 4TM domain-containing protein [Oceanibaculum nanhaiense]
MATSSNATTRTALFPPGFAAFLKRRAREAAGLALIALAVALVLSMVSYHPEDPSLNTANTGAVHNWLGYPGALAGDLLLQTLGLSGGLLALVIAAWGYRILAGLGVGRAVLRVALLPLGLLLAATALATVTPPAGWPLVSGLGGFTGTLLLAKAGGLLPLLGASVELALVGLAAGLLAALLLLYTLGFSLREWWALMRRSARMAWAGGELTYRGAAASGRLGSRLGGAAAKAGYDLARKGLRQEPSLKGHALSRDRAARDDDEDTEEEKPRAVRSPRLEMPREPAAAAPKEVRLERRSPAKPASKQKSLDLAPSGDFELPEMELLTPAPTRRSGPQPEGLEANARLLETVLSDFGVKGEIVKIRPGPVVTLYELEPAPGTKSSRVIGLSDDIARSMSAVSVRVAVVPGRSVIGIELPNQNRETVFLRETFESDAYERSAAKLPLALGHDIGGVPVIADLARMPHLLVAGTTGSGKSVAVNAMILSLLYKLPPERCRFIMIDPKMLELSIYDGIPHLLAPVVTDPSKAVVALKWTVREMENRYRAMSKLGVRNIDGYNLRLAEARKKGEVLKRRVQTGFDADTGKPVFEDETLDLERLPYIVVVVDEMADLMLVAGKDIEAAIQRLAQMARAAGIHIIMATQRPSVDVITGTIKANFPTRISFQVTSKIDSRTILGEGGAETLLGQGDMLYMAGGGRLTRVHGPFVSDGEVEDVVRHLKAQGVPDYVESVTEDDDLGGDIAGLSGGGGDGERDDLFDRAVELVAREGKCSTSFIQRYLQIGYNRAARIVERMEAEGMVSKANHVGKREVLLREPDE